MSKRHVSIQGGCWTNPATWVERRIPRPTDDVIIPVDTQLVVPRGNFTIRSLRSEPTDLRTYRLRIAEWLWRTVRRERWPW